MDERPGGLISLRYLIALLGLLGLMIFGLTCLDFASIHTSLGMFVRTFTPPTPTTTPTTAPKATPMPTPTVTRTPAPPPSGPMTPFAIDMSGRDTDYAMRDLAVAAGFRWVRTFVGWGDVEPAEPVNGQHTYHWPDGLFDVYRNDRRLAPLVVVAAPNPTWAVPQGQRVCGPIDPAHLADFGEFVYQLVARYADVASHWVFYNEQDQWMDHPGHDAGGCWGGHGAEYTQMVAVAWDAAHSADPDAKVIFGGVAYEPVWDRGRTWDPFFLRDVFRYMGDNPRPAGRDYVDMVMANQYDFGRDDWDGGADTLPRNQGVIAKFRQAVSDASFDANTLAAYSVARWQSEYGLDKPMGASEVGLQVSSGCSDVQICEELQARYVVHVNVHGLVADLKIIAWYTLVDKERDSLKYGLLRSDLTPRPAYYAYQVLTEQLNGYKFDQQLIVSGKPNLQIYRFDQGGVKKLVVWRDSGGRIKSEDHNATETMTISAAELGTWTGWVMITDKSGRSRVLRAPIEATLEISSDPVFVTNLQVTP